MLQLELFILIASFILGPKNNRTANILKVIGTCICLILCVGWLRNGKFMLILSSLVMIFFGYMLGVCIKEKEYDVLWLPLLCIVGALYLNRGITTRVYDTVGVLSFAERYNINHQLKYDGNAGRSAGKDIPLYIMTRKLGEDTRKGQKIIDKVRKKDAHYMVCLNYDEKGNFLKTGCIYRMPPRVEIYEVKKSAEKITERMIEDGPVKSVKYISQCVQETIFDNDYSYALEDDGDGWNDPGVHWVDGYDRQDGTHVDGYLRTNPDGDPTNNFSYYD